MAVHPGEEMIDILSEGEPDMSHMDYDLEYSVRVGKTEYVRKINDYYGLLVPWHCSALFLYMYIPYVGKHPWAL